MDNFMDKIVQKLNSQDMIRANSAADAAEMENLETQLSVFKDQMEKYDECLQEMRKLNLKNIESAQEVQQLTDRAGESIGKTSEASIAGIKETSDISIAGINQTVAEGLAKIAKIKENADNLEEITKTMEELEKKLQDLFKNMEDFLHTDNVKVYRNVQAAMIEELEKQTTEIKKTQAKALKGSKMVLPLVIVTMILTLVNAGIALAGVLGLF